MAPLHRCKSGQRRTAAGTADSAVEGMLPQAPGHGFVPLAKAEARKQVESLLRTEACLVVGQQGLGLLQLSGCGKAEGCQEAFAGGHLVSPEP